MLISCSFFIATLLISTVLGLLSVYLWNRGPLKWVCEYGQLPDDRHEKRKLRPDLFVPVFSLLFLLYISAEVYFSKTAAIPFPQLFVAFSLVQLSVSDIKFHILQDQWMIVVALAGFWLSCSVGERLLGAAVPALLYAAAVLLCRETKNTPMFGMGDIKFLCIMGFCFGLHGLYLISCIAFMASGLISLVLLLLKKVTKKDRIALGPFISVACLYFMLST